MDQEHGGKTVIERLPHKKKTSTFPLALGMKLISSEQGNHVCASGALAHSSQEVLIEQLNG